MIPVLEFQVPPLYLSAMAPVLTVLGGMLLSVLIEAFAPLRMRGAAQITLTTLTIAGALAVTIRNWVVGKYTLAMGRSVAVDGPTYAMWAMLLIFALLAFFMFAERDMYRGATAFAPSAAAVPGSQAERDAAAARFEHTEVFTLGLLALSGMMVFGASNDLITMFVALEVMSLPLYLLCALARRRRLLSQEAAMKYFMLGSMSSALFLFGIAMVYGYAGGFTMNHVTEALAQPKNSYALFLLGMMLMLVGLLFKIGAVPFHAWTPDVYMGAPSPVTAFMAACTKIAAVFAMLRVLFAGMGSARWDWQILVAVVAICTMLVGAAVAIMQTDVKRMLAYSSIAHAGFILTAVAGAAAYQNGLQAGRIGSVSSIAFYLFAYGAATMGAFAIVTMVRRDGGEDNDFNAWSGLGRRRPLLATLMAFFMLSFAGIPLTAGFVGKLMVFVAAWRGGYWWLVLVAVAMSLVAGFFYLRFIGLMFFGEPTREIEDARPSLLTWIPIVLGAAATLVFGLYPMPMLDVALQASQFLR